MLDSPKHSAALSRELADLERLAEPHWRLESLAAPLAPKKMCVGARALRARSAALSKAIVRTEQKNFAGGGAVAEHHPIVDSTPGLPADYISFLSSLLILSFE